MPVKKGPFLPEQRGLRCLEPPREAGAARRDLDLGGSGSPPGAEVGAASGAHRQEPVWTVNDDFGP